MKTAAIQGGRGSEVRTREEKINTMMDERKRGEFGIERKITDLSNLLNLLFRVFTTCSNRFTQART